MQVVAGKCIQSGKRVVVAACGSWLARKTFLVIYLASQLLMTLMSYIPYKWSRETNLLAKPSKHLSTS